MHTHTTQLTQSTLEANARFFADGEIIPREALTVGMGTIFGAKKIILLVSGTSKREVFKQLLTDEITTDCPATLLKLHPNVTVLCDNEACGE